MLKDANPGSFAGIYIVCGYTDYPRKLAECTLPLPKGGAVHV